ncbi:efflux transporter outer membrane subunit [Rugamonas sp. CCM 8940]|uniref:efflux transporter outer membrane subunit n=1 Tax=Rugamonas sp. CCM 8940 TaxID=2765359 RepID=UPI0018F5317F|nr:efflux transporter outer membrane subunit [Rugamonas sp. CCM 8940]MBJ7312311.1 efflux transporter outer membrane subunit [Rugamonas sp. CCM 8940]
MIRTHHTTTGARAPTLRRLSALVCLAVLGGCAVGPAYQTPSTPQPAEFKEARGWQPASPSDTLERGPWWQLFGDPQLDQLAAAVEVSNQNVAAAVASYAQARASVGEQRAALFPSVDLNGGANRSGGGGDTRSASQYKLNIGASWEPDVWDKLRAGANGAQAGAAASAADLAAARLSAQGELAVDYFSLRQTDAQLALLEATVSGYARVLEITQNRFGAGVAARSDVLQAQTQLAGARIERVGLARQRAQLEHAIAVLLGKAPAEFSLAVAPWRATVPDVPLALPSTLLQRRPDIAAAERRVAVANEQIGVARAAYFPSLNLSASYGVGGSAVAGLLNASNSLWSLGLSAGQSLFNAGASAARVSGAQAGRDVAVAHYRQTVLAAFADVENQLAASRALLQQQDLRHLAAQAADQVETQMLNRYRAGQVAYTEVVTAQNNALAARRALIQAQADRQTTAIALIQSLGGGWHATP